ncbi:MULTISPECIES: hypothetical protein [Sporosarcina]|uniref:Uncharacterized protein n=1 Tax=Sporosarcina psychrophila TaxID=1476 RepID=A0ABV2K5P8_SPOPS|nr:hypothetical protein [Sporosarcina sp. resist]QNK86716.1 hypothetical protein H7992_15875 [Sporosarcina sp. resist]
MRDYRNEDKCKYYHEYGCEDKRKDKCKCDDKRKDKCKCEDKHKDDHRLKPMVLSTGVLNTVVGQTAAHIEVANLDPTRTFQVRVQVINWNSGGPEVLLNQLVTLLPNQHINLSQFVEPFHYEVRIFHPGSPNVIANTFAINAGTFTLPGLTFNQKDLMKLDVSFI